jgi:glucose-1-phosphate cytidylyltransferase
MKVIILAGGFGSRISEYTKTIPKPMIKIKKKPILHHIMDHYSKYGHKEFYIALGYKGEVIKKYFKNKKISNWKINLIETGKNTMTGGRLKKFEKIINNETFMITYGDGLSDVNINKLVKFHKKNKKIATLTAVRPPARFGAVKLNGNKVSYFKEKYNLDEGWINGGFFVMEPTIFKYISGNKTFLEKEPLVNISKKKELVAFRHEGFWQCMDTKRDKELLEKNFKIKRN